MYSLIKKKTHFIKVFSVIIRMHQIAIDLSAGSFFLLDSDVYDADVFIGLVRLGIDFYI